MHHYPGGSTGLVVIRQELPVLVSTLPPVVILLHRDYSSSYSAPHHLWVLCKCALTWQQCLSILLKSSGHPYPHHLRVLCVNVPWHGNSVWIHSSSPLAIHIPLTLNTIVNSCPTLCCSTFFWHKNHPPTPNLHYHQKPVTNTFHQVSLFPGHYNHMWPPLKSDLLFSEKSEYCIVCHCMATSWAIQLSASLQFSKRCQVRCPGWWAITKVKWIGYIRLYHHSQVLVSCRETADPFFLDNVRLLD